MTARVARYVLRGAGWLLTPIVLITAAAIGATVGTLIAPQLSPNAGLILTVALALIAALAGLYGWVRLLQHSPELRRTFAVTDHGLPDSPLVDKLIHPEHGEQ